MAASSSGGPSKPQVPLIRRQFYERLLTKLHGALQRRPVDMDYLHYVITHELRLIRSFGNILAVPQDILNALSNLLRLINFQDGERHPHFSLVDVVYTARGQRKLSISEESLNSLINMKFSIPSIARLLGVSKRTLFRRMQEYGLSVHASYSSVTDDELDSIVRSVKMRLPHIGYRMMMGELQAMGYRVRWEQVSASMHRVDAAGILERMASVGCVARRVYSVKGPLSLVHVDTNHKLIRFVYSTCLYVQYSGYPVTIFISDLSIRHFTLTVRRSR
uniref:DNA binding HTH domain-containing protein n=1 Tax=Oreochromis niloticus TaxID=8128 RepID=A0A669DYN3_ORENI